MIQEKGDVRFRNILLLYSDNGLNILQQAARIAQKTKAKLTIIDIADELTEYFGILPPEISEQDLSKTITSNKRLLIEEQIHLAGLDGDHIDIRKKFGNPAVEGIRHVMEFDYDLVINTAVGSTRISERLLGNTAMKLLRNCPCPVLIAKPESPPVMRRVLAVIDPILTIY